MHEGHKVYIHDIQYFAYFALSFVCFVVKHILTYETAPCVCTFYIQGLGVSYRRNSG